LKSMRSTRGLQINSIIALTLFLSILTCDRISGQYLRFGVFADPVISWFSTDTKAVTNNGARAGFNFGFTFNKYFAPNYAFSSGINILYAGGRLINSEPITMSFNNFNSDVPALKPVVYKIQYISVPFGLKFKTNQIGYFTFFTDIGLDPKVLINGKADIPSLSITNENAIKELKDINLSYHIMAGIEYSLGGNTAIVLGLGYENIFLDITKDINNQPVDKVTQNILKFRIGVNF
jgi:opacity protein-like surface antigen